MVVQRRKRENTKTDKRQHLAISIYVLAIHYDIDSTSTCPKTLTRFLDQICRYKHILINHFLIFITKQFI